MLDVGIWISLERRVNERKMCGYGCDDGNTIMVPTDIFDTNVLVAFV